MPNFRLTIRQVSLNLPCNMCKLRFMIKADTSFPNYISQVSLGDKLIKLFLDEDIDFSVADTREQQAVSVYIVGITSDIVVHLGMFIVDLGYTQEVTKKIEGCADQRGTVNYSLSGKNINNTDKIEGRAGRSYNNKSLSELSDLEQVQMNSKR